MGSMIPSKQEILKLHRRYALDEEQFTLVTTHCKVVNEIALWCVSNNDLDVNKEVLEAACLLHDIGTYGFLLTEHDAVRKYYPQHAILGAKILEEEGVDPRIVEMVRTHVLLGLTKEDIERQRWALPRHDFTPKTLEARLLCYADRFHSKTPHFNSAEKFLERLSKDLPNQANKFKDWMEEFGVPDVAALAQKYNHPIR